MRDQDTRKRESTRPKQSSTENKATRHTTQAASGSRLNKAAALTLTLISVLLAGTLLTTAAALSTGDQRLAQTSIIAGAAALAVMPVRNAVWRQWSRGKPASATAWTDRIMLALSILLVLTALKSSRTMLIIIATLVLVISLAILAKNAYLAYRYFLQITAPDKGRARKEKAP